MILKIKDQEVKVQKLVTATERTCIELMQLGYVEGFKQFFQLTHEAVPGSSYLEKPILPNNLQERQKYLEQLDEDGITKRRLFTFEELENIKNLICNLEKAIFSDGSMVEKYIACRNLASLFFELKLFDVSIKYYIEALKQCNKETIPEQRVEAYLNLGASFEQSMELEKSMAFYELARKFSQKSQLKDYEGRTSANLIRVRVQIAVNMAENGNVQEAINRYMETLKVIQESCPENVESINLVQFQLGKAYEQANDIGNAIKYLESYLQYCKTINNLDKAGEAEATIARCYEKEGNRIAAIQHLESFARLAEDKQDMPSQISAYKQLGVMYNKLHNYSVSLKYFQRYYEIIVQSQNQASDKVCLSKCQVGISHGQASMSKYLTAIALSEENPQQLFELINWKVSNKWTKA